MNERVVEILIYIMSALRYNQQHSTKLDLLSKDLLQQGYTESEISSALSWILDRLNLDSEEIVEQQAPVLKSQRHLHEIERSIISPEAYGYIIQLKELDILDDLDVEEVLERALMLGAAQIDVEDLKSIVASVLFRNEGMGEGVHLLLEESSTVH